MSSSGPGALARRLLDQVSAFHYVTAPSAPTYRAVMQVFYEAKQRYVIELRPSEVLALVRDSDYHVELREGAALEDIEQKLGQLVEWGNLLRSHDTATVSRIDDFYRKRYLFHLTAVGEAAHRAVLDVEATVGKSGSLQTTMLVKIRDTLRDLASAVTGAWGASRDAADGAVDTEVDPGGPGEPAAPATLVRWLHDLQAAFDTLTQEANRFLGDLDRHLSGERMNEDRFVTHKQALLAYIGQFVEELRHLAAQIATSIAAVDTHIDRLVATAVAGANLPPALDEEGDDGGPAAQWVAVQHRKWDGIRAWFVGDRAGHAPTVERLADVAVGAVIGLTRTLGRLNDRRTRPVDRAADFRTLARWFTACATEEDAHRLWHAAFGLHSARHFHIAEEDAELTSPRASWWDAAPVEVPVRLRTRGNTTRVGRAAQIADYQATRVWIAQARERERARLEAAMRRFAGPDAEAGGDPETDGPPLRFGDMATLAETELALLLSLLSEVLGAPPDPDGVRRARTADGRWHIALAPPEEGDTGMVAIDTPRGRLRCRNYRLQVTGARAAQRGIAAPRPALAGEAS